MPDPISTWALAVLALLTLVMIFTGVIAIYTRRTYHLLSGYTTPHYTTAPFEAAEQAV